MLESDALDRVSVHFWKAQGAFWPRKLNLAITGPIITRGLFRRGNHLRRDQQPMMRNLSNAITKGVVTTICG
jgi:hypothetical protein